MHVAKIISGLGCIFAALLFGLFALICGGRESIYLAIIPAAFAVCLVSIGCLFVVERRSPLSKTAKVVIFLVLAVVIVIPIILDVHIRHERAALQMRGKEFLLRPIPKLLIPDSEGEVGGYYVDTNAGPQNGVFGYSQILIKRYADTGRIRWSARIQGQFAVTGEDVNANIRSDAIETNEEVRAYMAERNVILAKEWHMGFWQWVEDMMEFKSVIPEIEEEDQYNGWIHQLEGTWTNANSETMTISPNGTFSARWVSPVGTNIFKGTELFMGAASVLRVIRDTQSHILQDGDEKNIRILHVDAHNLNYELDGQTNSMSR